MKHMLIVNDELETAKSFGELFQNEGFKIIIACSEKQTFEMIGKSKPDIVLLDIDLKGNEEDCSGIKVFRYIRNKWSEKTLPVIIISRYLDSDKINQLETLGINTNYYPFPVENKRLLRHVNSYFSVKEQSNHGKSPEKALEIKPYFKSPKCIEINKKLNQLAAAKRDVVVFGERGTGKTLIAQYYHYLLKTKKRKKSLPWVRISCASLSEGYFEAQVFGQTINSKHSRKGLVEEGNHGVVFFDDADVLSKGMQIKMQELLATKKYRQLGSNQTKELDSIFIVAMCVDLETQEINKGLLGRLRRFAPIELPPLRERLGEIPGLVERFIKHFNCKHSRDVKKADIEVVELLKRTPLSGNIGDLEAIVENGIVSCIGDTIILNDIKDAMEIPEWDAHKIGGKAGFNNQYELSYGKLLMFLDKREVYVNGNIIKLTKMEFDILEMFMKKPGNVISRDDILNVLGDQVAVDTHIKQIRSKIKPFDYIKTIRGIGYKIIT